MVNRSVTLEQDRCGHPVRVFGQAVRKSRAEIVGWSGRRWRVPQLFSFLMGGRVVRNHQQNAFYTSAGEFRDACLVPDVSEQHRTGIRSIDGRNCDISVALNHNGSSLLGFGDT